MKGPWRQLRSAWRALRRSSQLDAAMQDEMRFHIEMEAERLVREKGLDPREARRQAHVRFGGLEKYKEQGRDTRGLQWLDAVSLDARLAVRMLVKHRGLTLVGGFAMSVAIAIGAMFFEVMTEMLNPALPMEDGGRVVALQYATAIPGNPERRVLHDFVAWREELVSIEQLAAFRTAQHNLVSGTEPAEPIKVAEITASGFAVARTPPLVGRYLLPADERAGAPPVVVLGHQAWQTRFAGDPQIVGRAINLGGISHAVAGVMPEGFRFPLDHQFWIPLRANPLQFERLQGPALNVFGRLAPGVTWEAAQAELTIVGQRAAATHPETHGRLRLIVIPYAREFSGLNSPIRVWMVRIAQLLFGALAFVVAVNLAILIYARTVTRLGEIAVRTALGASRRRILAQLFIEALALTVVGAAAGLVLAQIALGRIQSLINSNGSVPFWVDFDLSIGTVIYALGLAGLAAAIMGVLPGVKATGSGLTASLQELNGRTGTRLGPMWTTLVVAQIAVAVAVLPAAVSLSWQVVRMEVAGPGFAAEQFVVSNVALSDEASAVDSNRIRARQLELMSRLEAEPGVSAVTFSSYVPGFAGGRQIQFEDGVAVRHAGIQEISSLNVGLGMFDAYGARILAGRAFRAADLGAAHAVIVNRTFEQEFLDPSTTLRVHPEHGRGMETRSALGVRFRYSRAPTRPKATSAAEEWYQIIGVVRDFPGFSPAPFSDGEPTVYHPAAPGDVHPFMLSVRFDGSVPAGFIDRFRAIGAEVDPALQLRRVVPLSEFYDQLRSVWRYLAWGIGLVTTSVLLLSAAGIYALLSFTVAQRTREIGIRAALGAHPRHLVHSIFGRVIRQLALGLLVGSLLSGALLSSAGFTIGRAIALLLAVAVLMLMVGLLAALGPARRSLRIQAIEALRADG
jgi:putative ABC transport system permease protein